jgi:hypothetical protein
MGVNTGIPGSSSEVFAVSVRNVLACLGVSEPLRKAEVNYVNIVLLLPYSDQEVVRLYVSVQEVPAVNKLYSL